MVGRAAKHREPLPQRAIGPAGDFEIVIARAVGLREVASARLEDQHPAVAREFFGQEQPRRSRADDDVVVGAPVERRIEGNEHYDTSLRRHEG